MPLSKVPRWIIAYGVLMGGAAVGNIIGGVPETVSWQLLIGGGVLVLQAAREYLQGKEGSPEISRRETTQVVSVRQIDKEGS